MSIVVDKPTSTGQRAPGRNRGAYLVTREHDRTGNPFSREMYRLRAAAGWSLEDLRAHSGVDLASLSLMERGLTVPMSRNAQRLDCALTARGRLIELAGAYRRVKEGPSADIQRLLDDPDLMARLSPRRRQAVQLRYVEGLNRKDAAERMGVGYQGLRSTLKEAAAWSAEQERRTQRKRPPWRPRAPKALPGDEETSLSASVLVKREVVKDWAYACYDVDSPGGAVAVAHRTPEGWQVAVGGGRVVALKLTKQRAINVMYRAAATEIHRTTLRDLLTETRPAQVPAGSAVERYIDPPDRRPSLRTLLAQSDVQVAAPRRPETGDPR